LVSGVWNPGYQNSLIMTTLTQLETLAKKIPGKVSVRLIVEKSAAGEVTTEYTAFVEYSDSMLRAHRSSSLEDLEAQALNGANEVVSRIKANIAQLRAKALEMERGLPAEL